MVGALVKAYAYTGDPSLIPRLRLVVDHFLDHCLTGKENDWPSFPSSVPAAGAASGDCNEHGYIQLDLAAFLGEQILRAYQVTGERRWLEMAKHWGDLIASKRSRDPRSPPWPRYANPGDVPWGAATGDSTSATSCPCSSIATAPPTQRRPTPIKAPGNIPNRPIAADVPWATAR